MLWSFYQAKERNIVIRLRWFSPIVTMEDSAISFCALSAPVATKSSISPGAFSFAENI